MKDYLKMEDAFPAARVGNEPVKPWVNGEYYVFYEMQAEYAAHAINSHDELVAMNKELLGIINRIICTSTDLEGKAVSSPWSEGYKQCSIDTGKAIIEMLGRIEGCEK